MSGIKSSIIYDHKIDQFQVLRKDLELAQSLIQIRGQNKKFKLLCTFCIHHHSLDVEHNIVVKEYSEAQFISDLISEFDTLYQICNWAHQNVEYQRINGQMTANQKAWSKILSGNYDEVHQYLNEEEKMILNSLRPQGVGDKLLDFMIMSNNWSENWVLILERLSQQKPKHQENQLYKWAQCKPQDWEQNFETKFIQNLWLNLRAELFSKIMANHQQIYPKLRRCINFGINRPHLFIPKNYELNYDFNKVNSDEISLIGKKFIYAIIKYLLKKDDFQQLIDFTYDAIGTIDKSGSDEEKTNCYYLIGLMISQLMNLDQEHNFLKLELIKVLIKNIQEETSTEHPKKLKYIFHLLSNLSKNQNHLGFVFQRCQECLDQQGDSLKSPLDIMVSYQFDESFITDVAFENFINFSTSIQKELLSKKFQENYFDEEILKEHILNLLPYIIENIQGIVNLQDLFDKYGSELEKQKEYFIAINNKNTEEIFRLLSQPEIPYYWFINYITFLLNQPQPQMQKHINNFRIRITRKIKENQEKFNQSGQQEELLALIAKKMTEIKEFVKYLLIE